MDLASHVTALRLALEETAGDDDASQALAHRMAATLGPALQLQLLDLLGEVALEVSPQLPDGRLDLQLAGRDAVLVYRADERAAAAPVDEGSETSRLTVRMPEALKAAIEAAADTENVSTNTWLVAAARMRLSPSATSTSTPVTSKKRITGYVQA